ncbi:g1599 [Coccomyxa elongata]
MNISGGKQQQQPTTGTITSQLGGVVNYAIFSFWLFISFAGWIIALSCLSALQRYENNSGLSVDGGSGWAIKSNYPALNSGKVFRFDWFVVFYQFVLSFLVVIATVSRVLPQARISICGYLAIGAVLTILSADRLYNLSHFHVSKAYYSSSRGAFAGYLLSATSDFAMLYMAGLSPPAP